MKLRKLTSNISLKLYVALASFISSRAFAQDTWHEPVEGAVETANIGITAIGISAVAISFTVLGMKVLFTRRFEMSDLYVTIGAAILIALGGVIGARYVGELLSSI